LWVLIAYSSYMHHFDSIVQLTLTTFFLNLCMLILHWTYACEFILVPSQSPHPKSMLGIFAKRLVFVICCVVGTLCSVNGGGGFHPFFVCWRGGRVYCHNLSLEFHLLFFEIPKHTRKTSFIYGFFEFGFL
jgi:hypothetical protein